MRSRRNGLSRKAALVALLVLAPVAAAQDDDFTFFDTLDVHVVNVEVVVTGPDGAPVLGLTKDDFELFEDGRPVEIVNFYSVADAPPTALTPRADSGSPRDVRPPDQQLHLALFLDGMSLEASNRRRVLDAVREFFNYQLARPTSVVVATFDGNLEIESLPSVRPDDLEEVISRLEKAATRGSLRELERRALLADMDRVDFGGFGAGGVLNESTGASEAQRMLTAVRIHAQQQYDEARLSTAALESLVEAMAGLPGRKALLHISGGLARNPGEALYQAWINKFDGFAAQLGVNATQLARELDTSPELASLVTRANANRVTFYTIGAGRSGFPPGVSAEQVASIDLASLSAPGGGRSWSAYLESVDNSGLAGPIQQLAAETGGLSMTSSRNYENLLTDMNRDLGAYYSLGYTPDRARDGKTHKIKVRIKGRELAVRHRENYRELTRDELMTGRTRSAVMLGTSENPLEVQVEFGRMARGAKKKQFLVPIMVKVPLGNLVLVPRDQVHVGRIGIFVCARDGRNRTSPVHSVDVPIRIPNDQLLAALGQVAGYRLVLEMRGEEHVVAVGVRDELGRVESTVTDRWDPTVPTS